MTRIYKILAREEWEDAQSGRARSRARRSTARDSFIHFSAADQAAGDPWPSTSPDSPA